VVSDTEENDLPLYSERHTGPVEELDRSQKVELDGAFTERLAELFTRMHKYDHYEVLGVPRDADKETIKRAFYALAPTYHPDKHFGKELGEFRPLMDYIFGRMTMAFDTLTSPTQRERYDRTLAGEDVGAEPIRLSARHRELARGGSDAAEPQAQGEPNAESDEARLLIESASAALGRGDHADAVRCLRLALEHLEER
jgi:curved DNA-binding protein CbpA